MYFIVICVIWAQVSCAPVDDQIAPVDGQVAPVNDQVAPVPETKAPSPGRTVEQDTARADTEKNPVQEWFESLSKNTTTGAQNAMNTIKEWITNASKNVNNNNLGSQNVPTMYMGSFQLLKMPMPQFGDVIKGMGDLATAAQTFNKVTGGGLPQGIPLLSQG